VLTGLEEERQEQARFWFTTPLPHFSPPNINLSVIFFWGGEIGWGRKEEEEFENKRFDFVFSPLYSF